MMHGPGDDDLDEVKVTAKPYVMSAVKTSPQSIEEPMPEIVVQGHRIPWWVWGLAGGMLVLLVSSTRGSRR